MATNQFRAARLRRTGLISLAAGLILAGFVYGIGSIRAVESADNSLPDAGEKTKARDIQHLWGDGGSVMLDLPGLLARPGVQAAIIAAFSGIGALGCFLLAGKMEAEERNARRAEGNVDEHRL